MSLDSLLILDTGPGRPAWNMALDEVLLCAAADTHAAVLRFYSWTEDAATFGYSQRITDVRAQTALRPLIRRCTGGGIVPHDHDWTYSLVIPPQHPWYRLRAPTSYRVMHEWVQAAFARLGIPAELATGCLKPAPGQCFAGYEISDLLWSGRKIAGAAQRRSKSGLLIQGSVQPPPAGALHRDHWQAGMRIAAPMDFFEQPLRVDLALQWNQEAERLERDKYATEAHNAAR